jgi:hypothetical protein
MSWFTKIRDAVQTAAVLVANYYVPGSSMLTSRLASKGSQEQLGSDIGMIAQLATSIYGANAGNSLSKTMNNVKGAFSGAEAMPATQPTSAFSGVDNASSASSGSNATQLTANAPPPTTGVSQPGGLLNTGSQSSAVTMNPNAGMPNAGTLGGTTATAGQTQMSTWDKIAGYMDKAGAFIEKNPVAAMMGANMVVSGIAGAQTAEQEQKKLDEEKRRYDQGVANVNAVGTVNMRPRQPLVPQVASPMQGLLNTARPV